MTRILLTILASSALAACGGSMGHEMDEGMGGITTDAGNNGGGVDADAGTNPGGSDAGTDAGVVEPEAPSLTSVQLVVHGTMKLEWQNPTGGCDNIAVSRKSTGSYAVVKTVTGSLTTTNDSPGHMSGTYCYTLTCARGALLSPASNERCATQ